MNIQSEVAGAQVTPEGVIYRVWAPQVRNLAVLVLSDSGAILREISMEAGGADWFAGRDPSGRAGDRYRYRIDGGDSFPDPASRWQPRGVHEASVVVDPETYRWRDKAWSRPELRDLVIYELHIGTFSEVGTFRGAIEKLPALREIGINAIELMPIADFAGERNWGYDGVSLYAPAHAYGTPDDLRELVDAAHSQGIAVILDVVYNHFGPAGNYLYAYVGDYLDETKKTPWGGAIRYGDPGFQGLRDLVVQNPVYWMREFHIDGFRLDATHAIVDESPRHVLQELTAAIHAEGGFAIAEDARNDARVIQPESEGGLGFDAVWADDFHHAVRVGQTGEAESYFSDYLGTLGEVVESLQHGWLYRGQKSEFLGRVRGTECATLPPERFVHCVTNHDQVGNHAFGERVANRVPGPNRRASEMLLCLSPYTPMLFMGQEWGATTRFLFFTDHHEDLGRLIVVGRREEFRHFAAFRDEAILSTIPNPQATETFIASKLDWAERDAASHTQTLALYRASLALRGAEMAFRPKDRTTWSVTDTGYGFGELRLTGADAEWLVVFDLQGQHRGKVSDHDPSRPWEIVLSSNETEFGGDGPSAFTPETGLVQFAVAETVVLRRPLA